MGFATGFAGSAVAASGAGVGFGAACGSGAGLGEAAWAAVPAAASSGDFAAGGFAFGASWLCGG